MEFSGQDTANLKTQSFERQVSMNESALVMFKSTVQTEKKHSKDQFTPVGDGSNNPYEIRVQNSMRKVEQNLIERMLIIDTMKQKITFTDHYQLQDIRRNVKFEEIQDNQDNSQIYQEQQQLDKQQSQQQSLQQQMEQLQEKYNLLQQNQQEQQQLFQQQLEQKYQIHLQQQILAIRIGFEKEKEMLIQKQQLQIYQFKDISNSQNARILVLEDQILRRNDELRQQKVQYSLELEQKSGHIQSLYLNLKQQENRNVELEKQLKFYSTINDNLRDSMCSFASKSTFSTETPQPITKQLSQNSCLVQQQDELISESDSNSDQTGQQNNQQRQLLPERKHKIYKQPKISNSNFKVNSVSSSLSNSTETQEKLTNNPSNTNNVNYNNILIQKNAKYFANYFYLFLNNTAEAQTIFAETQPTLTKENIAKIIQDFNLQHTQKTLNRKDLMELISSSQLSSTFKYFLTHKAANLINLSTAKNKSALIKTLDVILNLFPDSSQGILQNNNGNKLSPVNLTSDPSNQLLDSSQPITETQVF